MIVTFCEAKSFVFEHLNFILFYNITVEKIEKKYLRSWSFCRNFFEGQNGLILAQCFTN